MYRLFFGSSGSGAPPPTAVTLNGPSSGAVDAASTNFNVGVDLLGISGTIVVTPATDVSSGGSFAPTSVSLTAAAPTGTFTFTPTKSGAHSISVTNDRALADPDPVAYTVRPAVTVRLVASPTDGTPQGSLTNLHWAWWDETDYNRSSAPTDHGSTGTTTGAGYFTVALPNSTKTNGQQGLIEIANSTATMIASGLATVT